MGCMMVARTVLASFTINVYNRLTQYYINPTFEFEDLRSDDDDFDFFGQMTIAGKVHKWRIGIRLFNTKIERRR